MGATTLQESAWIDCVGNGVANPGEGAESLLEVGGSRRRTDRRAGLFESFEEGCLGAVKRQICVAADGDEVDSGGRHRQLRRRRRLARNGGPQGEEAQTLEEQSSDRNSRRPLVNEGHTRHFEILGRYGAVERWSDFVSSVEFARTR